MSPPSPHSTLFEVFGRSETAAIPEINRKAVDTLVSILAPGTDGEFDAGKVVLLKSPRAGYGKTLLLQAVKRQVGEGTRFLAVEPSGGGRIDGEVVLDSVLRQLSVVLPASGGLTEFDFFARHLLALGLRPLLVSGEIPSHDREGALFAIENRPIETFDFHHQQAATAHWTQANFEVLGPRLAAELSEISQCGLRECAYWLDLLFKYATTAPEKVERTRYLTDAVLGDLQSLGRSAAEERLQSLLTLLALVQPVVVVFDETEGLSNRPEMGLKVAAFVAQLRQACPGLAIVFSLNDDVWQSGLAPLMPGGLEDRLTEYVVELQPMERSEAKALLANRFGRHADRIADEMTWPDPLYARAVVKEGLAAARNLELEAPSPVQEEKPAPVPPPLSAVFEKGNESQNSDEEDASGIPSPFEPQLQTSSPSATVDETPQPAPANPFEVSSEESGSDGPPPSGSPAESDQKEDERPPSPFETAMVADEQQTEQVTQSPFMIVSEPPREPKSPFETASKEVAQTPAYEEEDFAGTPALSSNPFATAEKEEAPSREETSNSGKSPFEAAELSPTDSSPNPFIPQPTNPFGAGVGQETPKPQDDRSREATPDPFAASPESAPAMASPFEFAPPEQSQADAAPNPFGETPSPASPFSQSSQSPAPEKSDSSNRQEESQEVENLLNQFKKRFGRPGGSS